MQQRYPPQAQRSRPRTRLSSSAGGLIGGAGSTSSGMGGIGASTGAGTIGRLAAQPRLPPRSTKLSEKLVLLPETDQETAETAQAEYAEGEAVDEELVQRLAQEKNLDPDRLRQQLLTLKKLNGDFDVDNDLAPLLTEEELLRRQPSRPEKMKSYAERLPKARRAEKLARVTAYCTAQAYKMSMVASFVKEWHGARTKLYDDCLYTAYHLPLLAGHEGYRLRSSPILKYPGGRSLLDEEIERNELRDHHDDYIVDTEDYSMEFAGRRDKHPSQDSRDMLDGDDRTQDQRQTANHPEGERTRLAGGSGGSQRDISNSRPAHTATRLGSRMFSVAEMFVFSYGVVVFWNFTERQEKDVLADLAFATSSATGTPIPLATIPLDEEDFETEEFHFEYSTEIPRPRVYNDMITLRSGDHMIKLAISHGIAQSTKLCFFEEVMARQMAEAKDVPRRLATTGKLGMKREEVLRILGKLFKSRVEINLSSNMLDVPHFFWESEPTLYPLYIAVREYLEIKSRIQVLNERCRVFLDLAEILSDSIADNRTSHQTWIIIVLILISIVVTISEVFLRFGLLSAREGSPSSSLSFGALLFSKLTGGASSAIQTPSCAPCVCLMPVVGGFGANDSGSMLSL